jgi:riboflavin transporter FmnP
MKDVRVRLSTLWVFMLFNYLYCDVVTGFDHTLNTNLSPDALLVASFLMEIPIAMVLLSRVLKYRPNRWANVVVGVFMTVVQLGSFVVGSPAHYYIFFSAIEIACLLFIVWTSWRWSEPVSATQIA